MDQVTVRITAGVGIIPAAGMERMSLEGLDPGDSRQLRVVQRAVADKREPALDRVLTVRADDPPARFLIPAKLSHARLEHGVPIQIVLLGDGLGMRPYLLGLGILPGRHVAGFLEKRHVEEGVHIAPAARVAFPIPDAAEVASGLDDGDVLDARLSKVDRRQHARPAAADDYDVDFVLQGRTLQLAGVRILQEMGELAFGLAKLRKSIGTDALGPLK